MNSRNAISLSRIFLHNWHRFKHHVIDVQDSLYLAGHNGSGKSSILDAIQVVLIADQTRVRYNSSAQERSARNLSSYVHGKIGENRLLRPGNTVAYVALEFRGPNSVTTVGICIEAFADQKVERSFFIINDALDPNFFISEGKPLTRRELRQVCRQRSGAKSYDQVSEYQEDLLNRLGGLNQRFFDLFLRALTFQPIRNINDFVEQWLLDVQSLDLKSLQTVVERLNQLKLYARNVQERMDLLQQIVAKQESVRTWLRNYQAYLLLSALLRKQEAEQNHAALLEQLRQTQQHLGQAQKEVQECAELRDASQQAFMEARLRLMQSDVVRRRDELSQELKQRKRELEQIRALYDTFLNDLRREQTQLRQISADPELPNVAALCTLIEGLDREQAPPSNLSDLLLAAEQELDRKWDLVRDQRVALRQQEQDLRARIATLERELAELRKGNRIQRNQHTEIVRERLEREFGKKPLLLCELLEVPEQRWQNAVEALLGQRRFNIVVPPENFERALQILDQMRASERVYDVGLIDLAKARTEARSAQANSLATKVSTKAALIRSYIDTILGDIITCETPQELRRYRRAVTPEVMVYSEWTARAIPPERYQPWYVGSRANRSQIEDRERQIAELQAQLQILSPQLHALERQEQSLDRGRSLATLQERAKQTFDTRSLQADIRELEQQFAALDLSGVAALEAEVTQLEQHLQSSQREYEQAIRVQARLEEQLKYSNEQAHQAKNNLQEQLQQLTLLREEHPQAQAAAEQLFAERQQQGNLNEQARNAENSAKGYKTRSENELTELVALGNRYNSLYQFAALPQNIDEPRYNEELQRLEATELPQYVNDIEKAQREAEQELREHVVHKLREQIGLARTKFTQINQALARLSFHNEKYRFSTEPAQEMRRFYDLIQDSQEIGQGSLFESEFYKTHQSTFDEFYSLLTRVPQSDSERRQQERLIDYRSYLNYDIEISHANGQISRLSRIMGQTSGGETQTPFYLTIAASFVQLYRIGERNERPSIRIVAFDEAFSKMDQDRIGATLDLFHQFGLQIITATPLERCEYLVPKMCTNLVISAKNDFVHIEDYRNYAVRLQEEQLVG
jgi:uncharacterized protein YPO0396